MTRDKVATRLEGILRVQREEMTEYALAWREAKNDDMRAHYLKQAIRARDRAHKTEEMLKRCRSGHPVPSTERGFAQALHRLWYGPNWASVLGGAR